jgi:ABC-type sugar transport system ATPase subunit
MLALLQQRSIRENIVLPAFGGIRNWGPIRMRAERMRVESSIARLQIDTRAGSELRRLSGGNQQKVVIARWLASGFNTLLCFDPTRGIDIGTKRDPQCSCSLQNFPKSRSHAIVRSSCSVGAWSPRCQCLRPMKPRCCAPRMGSPRWRRLPHDYALRR